MRLLIEQSDGYVFAWMDGWMEVFLYSTNKSKKLEMQRAFTFFLIFCIFGRREYTVLGFSFTLTCLDAGCCRSTKPEQSTCYED